MVLRFHSLCKALEHGSWSYSRSRCWSCGRWFFHRSLSGVWPCVSHLLPHHKVLSIGNFSNMFSQSVSHVWSNFHSFSSIQSLHRDCQLSQVSCRQTLFCNRDLPLPEPWEVCVSGLFLVIMSVSSCAAFPFSTSTEVSNVRRYVISLLL